MFKRDGSVLNCYLDLCDQQRDRPLPSVITLWERWHSNDCKLPFESTCALVTGEFRNLAQRSRLFPEVDVVLSMASLIVAHEEK